jgi:hypothetical protein
MTAEPFDLAHWLQDLSTRAWEDQRRAAERYSELVQRMASGELDAQALRDETMRFASEEFGRYAGELAQLSLSYYSALLELSRAYANRFFDQMLPGGPPPARARNGQAARAEPRQVSLELRGPVGGEATAAFVIENKRDAPADIAFDISDCVDLAGGSAFRAPLQVQPPWLTLGPQAEAQVRLQLPLLPELFAAGRQYRAKVVVHGYDELELIVTIGVEAAVEAATRVTAVATPAAVSEREPMAKKRAGSKRSAAKGTTGKATKRAGGRKPKGGPEGESSAAGG